MTTVHHRKAAYSLALVVFLIDQAIKWAVTVPLALEARGKIELLPFFDLTWTENWGVSMGFLTADSQKGIMMLIAMTAAIATGVVVWIWREPKREDALALALVLGGALGNILDRARFGYVVDYADLHFGDFRPFLVFNVADAAITIGVLLLLLRALLTKEKRDPAEVQDA